jgi:hypothetical protein
VVAGLGLQHVAVVGADRADHAGQLEGPREVDLLHARAREGRAQHRRVDETGKLDVRRVDRLPARPLGSVLSRRRLPDDRARALRPLVERVVVTLDHDPLLGVAALDLLLGPDQSRHVRTASSIRG